VRIFQKIKYAYNTRIIYFGDHACMSNIMLKSASHRICDVIVYIRLYIIV